MIFFETDKKNGIPFSYPSANYVYFSRNMKDEEWNLKSQKWSVQMIRIQLFVPIKLIFIENITNIFHLCKAYRRTLKILE